MLYFLYKTEVKKNVRNTKKILDFEKYKMEYIVDIKNMVENNLYDGGKYNIFLVFESKVRVIMTQGIYDKIINHYVTRYILIPKLEKYLNNRNCATRKGMGTSYAIKLLKNDIESFKKYDKFYFLIDDKCQDIFTNNIFKNYDKTYLTQIGHISILKLENK